MHNTYIRDATDLTKRENNTEDIVSLADGRERRGFSDCYKHQSSSTKTYANKMNDFERNKYCE